MNKTFIVRTDLKHCGYYHARHASGWSLVVAQDVDPFDASLSPMYVKIVDMGKNISETWLPIFLFSEFREVVCPSNEPIG